MGSQERKVTFSVLMLTMFFSLCLGRDSMLLKGSKAPDFTLDTQGGKKVALSEFIGKKYVVLIFYPGDETPVCTQQLCEIRDGYSEFEKRGAVVFGVNPASRESHRKFINKNSFQFPLLIDLGARVAKEYNAHGLFMNKRTVYVIDTEGKIVYAKRGKPPVSDILTSIPETTGEDNSGLEIDIGK